MYNQTLRHQEDISLYSNAFGFLRAPLFFEPEKSDADAVVTGIPFDMATSGRPGCRYGAQAIREASVMFAWERRRFPWDFALEDRMKLADCGDLVFPSGDPGAMVEALESHADAVIGAGKRMLSLGGDHFVTLPLLRAHARKYGKLALLHFDAHSDTYKEGSPFDHGTMFARAPKEGLIDPAFSSQIGIRTEYHEEDGFMVIDGPSASELSAKEIARAVEERASGHPVYLSFDIDCLDPAFAPGTGTPVPGGISSAKALEIIRALKGIDIVGADVVEVSPVYDHSGITAIAAAAIALDILYAMAS
ncbi:MAG: agmatinase [Aeromonadales bacterium]|nr:agmatinase [Aeromonadales bacterium]MDY2890269.1 agmatinase [Succinivibrio sp.]